MSDGRAGQDRDAAAVARAARITDELRENCGWTAALTPQTLSGYLTEEAHEVAEAIHDGRLGAPLASELGDVLFQILLHARLAQERGDFTLADVADALSDKLLRRNTHVFDAEGRLREHPDTRPGAAEEAWQAAKAAERSAVAQDGEAGAPRPADPLGGLPRSLPALELAVRALRRAGVVGQEAPGQDVPRPEASRQDPSQHGASRHEPSPLDPAGATEREQQEAELGEELLAITEAAARRGLDPERALKTALEHRLSREGDPRRSG